MSLECKNCGHAHTLHAEDGCYRYGCRCDAFEMPEGAFAPYHDGRWLLG